MIILFLVRRRELVTGDKQAEIRERFRRITICDALKELAAGLKPGVVPVAAPAPPFQGQPWSYGNLPPELD